MSEIHKQYTVSVRTEVAGICIKRLTNYIQPEVVDICILKLTNYIQTKVVDICILRLTNYIQTEVVEVCTNRPGHFVRVEQLMRGHVPTDIPVRGHERSTGFRATPRHFQHQSAGTATNEIMLAVTEVTENN